MSEQSLRMVVTRMLGMGSGSLPITDDAPTFDEWVHVEGRYLSPVAHRVLVMNHNEGFVWRCYACGAGGIGAANDVETNVRAHIVSCDKDVKVAANRLALVRALVHECDDYPTYVWNTVLIERLLLDGGAWSLIAENGGWPVGPYGIDGWDETLDSALARVGVTRETVFRR